MDTFTINKRMYYHHTDCGGVVYYANYLKFFEEARTEHLRSKGIDLDSLSKEGVLLVVASVDIEYKNPARYGEEFLVTSKIEKIKTASLYFYHEVKRNESLLVECRTKLVSVGADFRPVALPRDTINLLGAIER